MSDHRDSVSHRRGGEDNGEWEEEEFTATFDISSAGGMQLRSVANGDRVEDSVAAAFFEAAADGDVETVARMLDAKEIGVNETDVDGFTALMIASAEGQAPVVEALLERNASLTIRTLELGSIALHFAAKSGKVEIVDALCKRKPKTVNAENVNADTPLIWACIEGHVDAVRVLLNHKAEVAITNNYGATPLMCAVMLGDNEENASDEARAHIVRQLLERCPELVNVQDFDGSTAMHLAASCGHIQCVLALQSAGADIRIRNNLNQTALEEAEQTTTVGSRACAELLRVQWRMLEEEAAAQMLSMLQMEEEELAKKGEVKKKKAKKSKKAKKHAKQQPPSSSSTPCAVKVEAKEESGENLENNDEETVRDPQREGSTSLSSAPVVEDAEEEEGGSDDEDSDVAHDEEPSAKTNCQLENGTARDEKVTTEPEGQEEKHGQDQEEQDDGSDRWTTVVRRQAGGSRATEALSQPKSGASSTKRDRPSAQSSVSRRGRTGEAPSGYHEGGSKTRDPSVALATAAASATAARAAAAAAKKGLAKTSKAAGVAPSQHQRSLQNLPHKEQKMAQSNIHLANQGKLHSNSVSSKTASPAYSPASAVSPASGISGKVKGELKSSTSQGFQSSHRSDERSRSKSQAERPGDVGVMNSRTASKQEEQHKADDKDVVSLSEAETPTKYRDIAAKSDLFSGQTPSKRSRPRGCVGDPKNMGGRERGTPSQTQETLLLSQQSSEGRRSPPNSSLLGLPTKSGGALASFSIPRDGSSLEEMKMLLNRCHTKALAVDLDPRNLIPGSHPYSLHDLSMGQLDVLEEIHEQALSAIRDMRLNIIRLQERMLLQEQLKTQRDIQYLAGMLG